MYIIIVHSVQNNLHTDKKTIPTLINIRNNLTEFAVGFKGRT